MGQRKTPTSPPTEAAGLPTSLPITEAEAEAALASFAAPTTLSSTIDAPAPEDLRPLEAPVEGVYDPVKGGRPTTHGYNKQANAIRKARQAKPPKERESDPKTKKRNRFSPLALTGERKAPVVFTDERKWKYLEALAQCGLKGKAAAIAGVSTTSVEIHRKGDKNFALMENEALNTNREALIAEARRRSMDGVQKKVYQRGEQVMDACDACWGHGVEIPKDRALATIELKERWKLPRCEPCRGTGTKGPAVVTEYSDRLLETMLKAHDNRFRDKQVTEVNINGGVLFAPQPASSSSDWEKKWGSKEPIDITPEKK